MNEEMLSTGFWLKIKKETRNALVDMFNIPRSGGSSVDNTNGTFIVTSDGHTSKDLSSINVESLQKKLKIESSDFYKMLVKVINDIEKVVDNNNNIEKNEEKTNKK